MLNARLAGVAVLWIVLMTGAAATAELAMFRSPGCVWCERWDEEIGVAYPKTDEGRCAPLSKIMMDAALPPRFQHLQGLRYSPTFVLMDGNREIGRIVGYPGEEFFWPMLDELLVRMGMEHAQRGETGDPCAH